MTQGVSAVEGVLIPTILSIHSDIIYWMLNRFQNFIYYSRTLTAQQDFQELVPLEQDQTMPHLFTMLEFQALTSLFIKMIEGKQYFHLDQIRISSFGNLYIIILTNKADQNQLL